MDPEKFISWLADELAHLNFSQDNLDEFQALVSKAISLINEFSKDQKELVLCHLENYHKFRMLGNYRIQPDSRFESDVIEEMITIIEGYLEDKKYL
ncbi:MAG: hypothetical protein AB9891_12695 [Anaerolineaceae bacterium]